MPKVARVSCSVLLIITSGCACGPAKFVTPNTQATVEPTVEPTVLPTVASERATPLESPRNGSAGTDGTHVLPVVFDIQVPADGMQIPTVPVAPAESSVADERGSTAPDKVTGTAPNPAPPTPLLSDMNGDAITSAAALQLNFPSAMALVDSRHPIVGIARWRVRESYGQLARAQMLWLPSIQAGFSFHRHDGNYQASNGDIVDVKRSSFQFGLGAGATGAGTTSARPGLIAQFHLADAIFQPKIMEKTAWARGHAANATLNEQLMNTGIAYIELVDAYQGLRIADETRLQMAELARITDDFATAGEGLRSDADRLQTELRLIEVQVFAAEEQIALASARLAHAASIDPCHRIVPLDVNAVPLELADVESDSACLISTALRTRPELKESQ
ncbi:MAG: TolC family protein, partial [Planctomycetales bacterium]|nr:TolC family protein [Planctomycetales bacterium]